MDFYVFYWELEFHIQLRNQEFEGAWVVVDL